MQQLENASVVENRRRSEASDLLGSVTMLNDSMAPRYEKGETVVYNKTLQPAVGDDVVIVRRRDGGLLVRRLVGFDGRNFRVLQFEPHLEADLPIADVAQLFPCVGYEALAEDGSNTMLVRKKRTA